MSSDVWVQSFPMGTTTHEVAEEIVGTRHGAALTEYDGGVGHGATNLAGRMSGRKGRRRFPRRSLGSSNAVLDRDSQAAHFRPMSDMQDLFTTTRYEIKPDQEDAGHSCRTAVIGSIRDAFRAGK